ncbi:hypothetical protein NQ314_001673 [Rhamnusium bicolor]|uniref:PiggyBac transposable element-derived protein domain-containing protein n=1 Tax=Rhamnusium bicolor TaxID=1586634 RepID=A0AAV8ZRC8_9CUCU|nr:hypothetical protein NQ314_001673 [Rhamnusium bicolor]
MRTIPLLVYLSQQGIYSLGTVRRNRIPNCKLPDENALKEKARGTSKEFVGVVDGVEISSVVWKDNKIVTLLSTFAGINPSDKVSRFDKKKRKSGS